MDSSIWDNALKLLKFDENIDLVTYESILCKMSVAHSVRNLIKSLRKPSRQPITANPARSSSSLKVMRMLSIHPLIPRKKPQDRQKARYQLQTDSTVNLLLQTL